MVPDGPVEGAHCGWAVEWWVLVEALVRAVVGGVPDELVADGEGVSLVAALRASSLSQPNTRTAIKYSSRNSTVRNHAVIPEVVPNARSRTVRGVLLYSPANSFLNGNPVDGPSSTHVVNATVPNCPP